MKSRWMAAVLAAALLMAMGGTALADEGEGEAPKEELESSDVQVLRAWRLAEYFAPAEEGEEPDEGDVEALAETIALLRDGEDRSVGWGVLYKLLLIADYYESDLGTYLDGAEFDEGWGLGKILKELRQDPDWPGDNPKNFGQWKKQQKQAEGWEPPGKAKKNG